MLTTSYNQLTPEQAVAMQRELRDQVQLTPLQKEIRTIGGADISFNKFSDIVYAGIIVLSYPDMQVLYHASAVATTTFPYVPGLLGFREVPALAEVWNKLEKKPDVLVLDGHGIAHPRRLGIATHFGLVAGTPTIGCAKTLLTGKHGPLGEAALSISSLMDREEQIGEVLRTKDKCNPVYISPGNLITMQESMAIIRHCIRKYRIPEPTRLAHLLVNEIRLAHSQQQGKLL